MSDIAFDEIRAGQTVRAHCRGGYSVEGPVIATGGYLVFGNAEGSREVRRDLITRVELLSEPAPKWEVGQLAEIDWSSSGCAGATRQWLASWNGSTWHVLGEGALVHPGQCGEPRLLKPVPADAVVLPERDGKGKRWDASRARMMASLAHALGHSTASSYLHTLADAIEEAQR